MYKKTAIIGGRKVEFINASQIELEHDIEVVTEITKRNLKAKQLAGAKNRKEAIETIFNEAHGNLEKIEEKYEKIRKEKNAKSK